MDTKPNLLSCVSVFTSVYVSESDRHIVVSMYLSLKNSWCSFYVPVSDGHMVPSVYVPQSGGLMVLLVCVAVSGWSQDAL